MNKKGLMLSGLALGAGLMYLLDPDRGRRRRARIRDAAVHLVNTASDAIDKTGRDVRNRAGGLVAEFDSALRREKVEDEVLVERVRSKLGRVISHPHAVEVTADQGQVTLKGEILASEEDSLLNTVFGIQSVTGVINKLTARDRPGRIPGLQGGVSRQGETFEWWQTRWSPTAQLLAGVAGSALALYGIRRKGIIGAAVELTGLGLLARGLTNREIKDVIGVRGGRGISVQKTININAPVERVFNIWSHHEYFPYFMSNVREVKDLGDGRYHWSVRGPGGLTIDWEGVVTERVPNQRLAFESVAGSTLEQKGTVNFRPNRKRGTQVEVKMSYCPPAGVVGHLIAKLFGADLRTRLDEQLMRMKTFIETQRQPHDAVERRVRGKTMR